MDMVEFVGDPSWVFDLVSTDDRVRERALARHKSLIAAASAALHWMNGVWARAGTPAPAQPRLAAEMDQARTPHRHYLGQTIFELVARLWDKSPEIREQHAQFALLYLIWERRHPTDWRAQASNLWSPWGRKESVLAELARNGIPTTIRPRMTTLVTDLPRYPYRCKDWLYAPLTRQIRTDQFDQHMRHLLTAPDPMVRSRAAFLLHVADTPTLKVTRRTFARWLANDATLPRTE